MTRYTKYKLIIISLIAMIFITGCSEQIATEQGVPIEPLVPGAEEESAFSIGQFTVKSSDVQITDLSVTADGSFAVVATAAKEVYLLGKDGKPLWESQQATVPLQAQITEDGRFVAVGTEGGKLLLLNSDQSEIAAHQFDAPITQLDVCADGELLLVGLHPSEEDGKDSLIVLDKKGEMLWQQQLGTITAAKIAGADKRIIVNWLEGDTYYLGAFAATGEALWELKQHSLLSLDNKGETIISVQGEEIYCYDQNARKMWDINVTGDISRVLMANSGTYLAAIITDPNTQRQNLIYLDMEGNQLWERQLPVDASVLVSADGKRIFVSSWGQYQDDVTQIFIYNEWGQEINMLEISGRLQKMAFAVQSDTIVIALNEGNIYFLNINAPINLNHPEVTARELTDYYQPVTFERKEEETLLTLFFYDQEAQYLIPVTRIIKKSQSLLRDCIQELIRGPAQDSQLARTIPKDAQIGASVEDGMVRLDLPATLDQMSGSSFIQGVVESLIMTVSSVPTVEKIQFTVAGKNKQTFGQEGIMIGDSFVAQPLGRQSGEALLFVPARSGNRYYLRPISEEYLPLKEHALADEIIRTVLMHYKQNFGDLLLLQESRFDKNTIYVDLHTSSNSAKLNSVIAAARAAMLRDALAISLVENLPYTTIIITVDGKEPPKGEYYLPWELTVKKPYYVNLEN